MHHINKVFVSFKCQRMSRKNPQWAWKISNSSPLALTTRCPTANAYFTGNSTYLLILSELAQVVS